MGLLSFLNKEPTIKGEIGYYKLSKWWLSELSNEERNYIVNNYSPFGFGPEALLETNINWCNLSVITFLQILAGGFNNKKDRELAIKILKKAEELISDEIPIIEIHFFYQQTIKVHYCNRNNDPKSLDKAIWACDQQIEISLKVAKALKEEYNDDSLPEHVGYKQLAIIKKKEWKYQEVIDICSQALQEGWRGDWEERIEWGKKKLHYPIGKQDSR